MATKIKNGQFDDDYPTGKRRTKATVQRANATKSRRRRANAPAVPGMQQRRNKHWSW